MYNTFKSLFIQSIIKISIIIPAYNEEKTISRLLKSIKNQKRMKYERKKVGLDMI
ncbi:glycosyltransferase [Candidatus Pacearchaeota archaeon]|nr:glycosyltransferase [Candidatus Pacearchaeota archaeon]